MHFPCNDQQKQAKRINILLLDSPFFLEHRFQGTWQVGCSRNFGESQSFWEFNFSVPDWLYQGSVLVFCLAVGLIVALQSRGYMFVVVMMQIKFWAMVINFKYLKLL